MMLRLVLLAAMQFTMCPNPSTGKAEPCYVIPEQAKVVSGLSVQPHRMLPPEMSDPATVKSLLEENAKLKELNRKYAADLQRALDVIDTKLKSCGGAK